MMLTLSTCLTIPTASETNKAILHSVHSTLPTASRNDTAQTQREIAIHRKVVFDLCKSQKAGCAQ